MKITSVEARDLSEAWFLCLRQVLTDGYEYTIERGSYTGQKRKELDMITVHIKNPGNRPLIPDVPPGVPAPSTMEYIDNYLPYLMTAHRAEGEQYTYGQYLEAQIAKVIKMYRDTGFNTNQAFMTVGNPETLDLEDPPCLRSIDTRVRYGKLHFVIYFRSWDLWAGFPSNLAAIQMLKEYMAAEIGVEDGEIIAMSKGMHIYDYAWDIAKTAAGMNGA
ncbi:MAG: thymidylate synthase [Dehalococcoides mccartyi]|uniref:Thymidylate synthase n=2 Tax=root TaxID=1 RepID=A0AB33HT72_9CHLR|nr:MULTISPECIES: thymidylate synthase [Dehalococcoides]MBF4482920.1 thymidylate synthase [Dehalococcoides mccartyi]MBJ7532080.1 thymidylate synthase [Dehalococcoides mccartyi]MCF7635489.1 thymidylate synthase [Dehalococcoides mccartyi]MDP4280217.1 thymidylate synthase [Dehalococcoides mccartyi]MEA2121113.1 Thymidylate synthase [Dehalococcoides mccartyi]